MRQTVFFIVFLILMAGVQPAQARLDPALHWNITETAHFRILFTTGYEEWAARTAQVAEAAHEQLSIDLNHTPAEQTTVVLADVSDLPNGMATPFPANRIILYVSPPQEEPFELTDREDWLKRALIHEYAHILQLDQVELGPATVQKIFGRLYFPNLFQPAWLIEGLATWEETRQTDGGRGRASYTDMVLRMAILDRDFPTLAQAGVFPERWPGGATPYLFGVAFYQQLVERYGETFPGAISTAYAGRSWPFLVDSTARQVIHTTYEEEWHAWRMELAEAYGNRRLQLERQGLTPLQPLTRDGGENLAPSPSPDGRYLAWSAQSADRIPSLMLQETASGASRAVSRRLALPANTQVAWSRDSQNLLFAQAELDARDNLFGDLYRLSIGSDQLERLTTGLRVASPDLHPLTNEIVCTVLERGRTRLVLLTPEGQERAQLADGQDGRLFSTPRWSPDGERLAVGVRVSDGSFTIEVLDRSGARLQQLPAIHGIVASPAWTPDGRMLLFTSDRSGIFNLYAWRLSDDALFQVTNLLGGAFSPALSADGTRLYLSSYSARGFDLAQMPLDPASWQALAPDSDQPLAPLTTSPPAAPVTAESYVASFQDLRPRYWLPWFSSDNQGLQLGMTTSGSDPLGRHSYAATALYGTASQRPAGALLYQYDGLFPTVIASVADEALVYADFYRFSDGSTDDYWERQRRLGLDFDFPSAGLWSRHHLVPGLRFLRFDRLDAPPTASDAPPEGKLSGVRLAWRYGDAVKPGRAISLEDGRFTEVAAETYAPETGSDYRLSRQSLDWHEFFVLPKVRHQVLAPRLFLGRADGDLLPQRAWQAGGDSLGDLPTTGLDTIDLPLRGYRPNTYRGQNAVLGSLEYRFPLVEIDDGFSNGLLYLRRVHGALFAEGADLFDRGGPRLDRFHTAAGAEARIDFDLGYRLPLTLRVVAAKGFDDEGEGQIYTALWMRF